MQIRLFTYNVITTKHLVTKTTTSLVTDGRRDVKTNYRKYTLEVHIIIEDMSSELLHKLRSKGESENLAIP
jgi:hypothetical protein